MPKPMSLRKTLRDMTNAERLRLAASHLQDASTCLMAALESAKPLAAGDALEIARTNEAVVCNLLPLVRAIEKKAGGEAGAVGFRLPL